MPRGCSLTDGCRVRRKETLRLSPARAGDAAGHERGKMSAEACMGLTQSTESPRSPPKLPVAPFIAPLHAKTQALCAAAVTRVAGIQKWECWPGDRGTYFARLWWRVGDGSRAAHTLVEHQRQRHLVHCYSLRVPLFMP